ncbi:MAG: TrbI/VirB10 family protein [Alphaproteobacteria bacterium]|nr:TrbI/VirB10 family protein [Alphaproteobacteria bacterium]
MNTAAPPPPPPPPMDDPFTSNAEPEGGGLDTGAPSVAASKGKTMMVMGALALVAVYLLYSIFFGGGGEEAPVVEDEKPRPIAQQEFEPPPLPEEPPVLAPPPIIEAPPVPQPTVLPAIEPEEDNALKAQMQARQRSNMMVVDGGNSAFGGTNDAPSQEAPIGDDPNSAFAAAAINNSKADQSIATRIGDLRRVIAQGRMIQATLETAINTDLPAPIRAVVSRDVYGEAGTKPLIPVGSRLIGQYNTSVTGGQSRVFVIWTRAIRPDGIDVQLGSQGVDQIGQAGIAGQVDTKFQAIFSRAVMSSVVSIALALASDEISPGDGESSTTSSTFGTTQSGDAASTATVNALNRLGSVTETFMQGFLDLGPTILVDQGTQLNVFVNRDLIFPAELVGSQIIN